MRAVNLIIEKELKTAVHTPYTLIIFLLCFVATGSIYWFSFSNFFNIEGSPLSEFFFLLYNALFFFIPFLTMKSFSEEKRLGTLEFLLFKPLKINEIIGGKFLSIFLQVILFLLLTSIYLITVAILSDVNHISVICGYLGLLLISTCYISIGLFASSLTSTPIIALLISFAIGVLFRFFFNVIADLFSEGVIPNIFNYLAIGGHFDSISRGVIDTRDLIYLFSVTIIFISLTRWSLSKEYDNRIN